MAIQFRNPVFRIDGKVIDCEIFQNNQWLPLTLNPDIRNISAAYVELYAEMKLVATPYVKPADPVFDPDKAATDIRIKRYYKLSGSVDPIVSNPFRWNALTVAVQDKIVAYRQALLDVTTQTSFPNSVTWPTEPTELTNLLAI